MIFQKISFLFDLLPSPHLCLFGIVWKRIVIFRYIYAYIQIQYNIILSRTTFIGHNLVMDAWHWCLGNWIWDTLTEYLSSRKCCSCWWSDDQHHQQPGAWKQISGASNNKISYAPKNNQIPFWCLAFGGNWICSYTKKVWRIPNVVTRILFLLGMITRRCCRRRLFQRFFVEICCPRSFLHRLVVLLLLRLLLMIRHRRSSLGISICMQNTSSILLMVVVVVAFTRKFSGMGLMKRSGRRGRRRRTTRVKIRLRWTFNSSGICFDARANHLNSIWTINCNDTKKKKNENVAT